MTITSLRPADRERILARLAELRALDRMMRQPGTLATPPPPAAGTATGRTAP